MKKLNRAKGFLSSPEPDPFSFLPESARIAIKPPFSYSVLFIGRQQDKMDPVQGDLPILFEPSICGIIYNLKWNDMKVWKFETPEQIAYEAVRIEAHRPPQLIAKGGASVGLWEYVMLFYFSPRSGYKLDYGELELRKLEFEKSESGRRISLWKNTRDAALIFLKKLYPDLTNAIEGGCPNEARAKAFVLDTIRRTGKCLCGLSSDGNLAAKIRNAQRAFKTRKSQMESNKIDAHLVTLANWARYYSLRSKPKKIAELVSEATGTKLLSEAAMEKRIERLKLIPDCRRGPR